jgi:hypothetical protein
MSVGKVLGILAVALFTALPRAMAQVDTGSIDGTVVDEQKAAVPGATITAKNTNTGLTRMTVSSGTGTFHLESLPAGPYDVTAELQGFTSQLHKGVLLEVGQATAVDFTMKVGAITEKLEVIGETPLVQTTRSDVGQVIAAKLVENIPLNGRKFQDLSLLVPGTRPANYYDPTKTEVGGISYSGMTGRSVIINVDGFDNNDGVVRGLLQQFSAEAIQEYKVTTQRYSAEFGRSVGGVVNVITKSGTNTLTGSVIAFGRNEKFNANDPFLERQGRSKPPFSQFQPGGSVGGPIKPDKAHFFVAYEWNRRNDFASVNTGGILKSEEGDFPKPFRNHLPTLKADFEPATGQTVTVRYAREDQKREHDFIGGNVLASAGASNTNLINSVVGKHSWVTGGGKLNELLLGYSSFENNILAENSSLPGVQTPDFFFGANTNTPQQTIQKRFQARDDYSWRVSGMGDHNLKAGAEILRTHIGGYFTPTLYGQFIFSKSFGSDLSKYLNGIADTFTGSGGGVDPNVPATLARQFDDNWTYTAEYIQDDWKVNRRLTLNLGLRYEVQAGPYQNKFDTMALRALAAAGRATQKTLDKNNIGPRIGFAYDLLGDGKQVIRGGYGRYYDEIFQNITLYEYWSDVTNPTFFISLSPAPFTPNQFAANRAAIRNSFVDPTFSGQLLRLTAPDLIQPSSDQFNAGWSGAVTSRLSFDVDYVHQNGHDEIGRWRINTAQNQSTRLSPAGIFAPTLGPIIVEGNRGHSRYDGVYVTGKARMDKLTLISSYTWSLAKNQNNDFGSYTGDLTNLDWDHDYGYAPNDIRHRVTLGSIFELPMGWQYSTTISANTGKPFNAYRRATSGSTSGLRAFDPATGLELPRNSFRQDGAFAWNMRVTKAFPLGAARSVDLMFDVFNISNYENYGCDCSHPYTDVFSSPNFGKPNGITPNSQREAEFGVRFRF